MSKRRVILTRPVVTRRDYSSLRSASNSSTPAPANAHTRTRSAELTTTTNVVSVVSVAQRERERTHAREAANIDQLLEQILALEPTAQKELLDRVAAHQLLSSSKPADRDVSMWAVAVYDAYCKAVGGPGAAGVGPHLVRKVLAASAAWAPVAQFMAGTALQDFDVTDRQAIYMLLADLLVKQARSIARYTGAPCSPKLIANCTANIGALFDDAFPGYLEAGLVTVVARQLRAKVAA